VEFEKMQGMLMVLKQVLPKWAPPELTKGLIGFWAATLEKYSDEQIKAAFRTAGETLTEWPTVTVIARLCEGTIETDEQIGQEICSKIETAIKRFGYSCYADAMNFVGPIGQQVVRLCGGWDAVCQCSNDELPSLRKQWRTLATIQARRYYLAESESYGYLTGKSEEKRALVAKALSIAGRAMK